MILKPIFSDIDIFLFNILNQNQRTDDHCLGGQIPILDLFVLFLFKVICDCRNY